MGFFEAVGRCLRKYAWFGGRASRQEFWWFWLFTMVFNFIPILSILAALVLFLPTMAVSWRRFHDIGLSGWWGFLPAVPVGAMILIGYQVESAGARVSDLAFGDEIVMGGVAMTLFCVLMVFIWLVTPGDEGPNAFGERDDDHLNPRRTAEIFA